MRGVNVEGVGVVGRRGGGKNVSGVSFAKSPPLLSLLPVFAISFYAFFGSLVSQKLLNMVHTQREFLQSSKLPVIGSKIGNKILHDSCN